MKVLKLALILAIVSAISGGCLASIYNVTDPIIVAHAKEMEEQQLAAIYGEDATFEHVEDGIEEYKLIQDCYVAKKNGETIGTVYKISSYGYGGNIVYLLAIDLDGKYVDYAVIDVSTETSGFGSRVGTDEMKNKVVGQGIGSKVDTLTGATISSTAVVKGITQAGEHYQKYVKEAA